MIGKNVTKCDVKIDFLLKYDRNDSFFYTFCVRKN